MNIYGSNMYLKKEKENALKNNDQNKARGRADCLELSEGQSCKIGRLLWISKLKSLLIFPTIDHDSRNCQF